MSKFFVGQRVRLVCTQWVGFGPSPRGQEGRITKCRAIGATTGIPYEWEVTTASGQRVQCNSCELEPILPEGAAPSEFTFQQLIDSLQEAVA